MRYTDLIAQVQPRLDRLATRTGTLVAVSVTEYHYTDRPGTEHAPFERWSLVYWWQGRHRPVLKPTIEECLASAEADVGGLGPDPAEDRRFEQRERDRARAL